VKNLKTALSGRTNEELEPVVTFLIHHITNPRYASSLVDVSNILLDIYAPVLGLSICLTELLQKLKKKIYEELLFQKQMFELLGTLDLMINSSASKLVATEAQTTDL